MKMHNPPHPGEVIRGLCLEPLSLTVTGAATALGVSRKTLSAILNGRAGISPEMAVRLSMAFGTSADSWMNQQAQYDLWHAERRRKEFKVTRLVAQMPPVEMYTSERISEFERETQVDAETQVAVLHALAGATGA